MGNLRDATAMTRMITTEAYINKVQEAAARSQDPLARARALQLEGKLRAAYEPEIHAMNLRQTLEQGAKQGLVEPEQLVPLKVPKEHQKDVFHSIDQAKYANAKEDYLMKLYKDAREENTITGIAGRLGRKGPATIALENEMLPLVHDKEGKVNEYEFETTKNFLPHAGTTDERQDELQKGFHNWLMQKKNASTARAFGINLEDFPSTRSSKIFDYNPKAPRK